MLSATSDIVGTQCVFPVPGHTVAKVIMCVRRVFNDDKHIVCHKDNSSTVRRSVDQYWLIGCRSYPLFRFVL